MRPDGVRVTSPPRRRGLAWEFMRAAGHRAPRAGGHLRAGPGSQSGFYSAVLGWEFTEGTEEFGGYTTARGQRSERRRMSPSMPGRRGRADLLDRYLATADSAATEAAITAAGGQVIAPTMTLGDLGAMGIYADPTGAVFGTGSPARTPATTSPTNRVRWPGARPPSGTSTPGSPSTPTSSATPYLDMSGPGAAYAMFSVPDGDRPAGGLSGLSPDRPPSWSVTFETDGVDAAVAGPRRTAGPCCGSPSTSSTVGSPSSRVPTASRSG